MKKDLIELIGTYLYVLVNLYTRNGIIIGFIVATLIMVSALGFSYKGSFTPTVLLGWFLSGRITQYEFFINFFYKFITTILAFVTYKMLI